MRISDLRGFGKGRLGTTRVCSQCGLEVDDKKPAFYCPECGHKFVHRPELVDSDAVARLVDAHLAKGGKLV